MILRHGAFSYLPDLTDDEIALQVRHALDQGWPVSVEHDLPALGLPACATPDQAGCMMSWSSYAEPADPSALASTTSAGSGIVPTRIA